MLILNPLASYSFGPVNPDENPLSGGGSWATQTITGINPLQQEFNRCVVTVFNSRNCANWQAITWPNDQYSSVVVFNSFGVTSHVGAQVRASLTTNTRYEVITSSQGAPAVLTLSKWVNNVQTVLHTEAKALNPMDGDILSIAVVGTTLYVLLNGAVLPTFTTVDSDISSGYAGVVLQGNVTVTNAATSAWSGGGVSTPAVSASPTRGTTAIGSFEGKSLAVAFTNPQSEDLVQVINEDGQIVWNLTFAGVPNINPANPTSRSVIGRFKGSAFSTAFPNPALLDVLQVASRGGKVVFWVDKSGAAYQDS